MRPFISVIIPVYNVEDYIERCIDSFLAQAYDNYELLLVDDGSTDKSGIICDQYANEYLNIRALHKENSGLGGARNYGIIHATGEYITFIDSDDWVDSNYFEVLYNTLISTKPDMFKFGYRKINEGKVFKIVYPYYNEGVYDRDEIEYEILPGAIGPISLFDYSKTPLLSACVCVYASGFIKEHALVFENERVVLNEDNLFNIAALLKAKRVVISHQILYNYDFREGSLSKRYLDKMVERKEVLLKHYRYLLFENGVFEKYSESFYSQSVDSYYACIVNECSSWGNNSKKQNVKRILNLTGCQNAIKMCKHNNLSGKGKIIYLLMKYKLATMMCFLYGVAKKV